MWIVLLFRIKLDMDCIVYGVCEKKTRGKRTTLKRFPRQLLQILDDKLNHGALTTSIIKNQKYVDILRNGKPIEISLECKKDSTVYVYALKLFIPRPIGENDDDVIIGFHLGNTGKTNDGESESDIAKIDRARQGDQIASFQRELRLLCRELGLDEHIEYGCANLMFCSDAGWQRAIEQQREKEKRMRDLDK